MKYNTPKARKSGWTDWIRPILNGYKISCCDCGLVHKFKFEVEHPTPMRPKGNLKYKVRRDERATAAKRRYMK